MLTECSLDVQRWCPTLWTSLDVHWMFTGCSLNVHWMFTECSLNVHWMFHAWSLNVHRMFTKCSLNVHCMFTECSLNVYWMFIEWSLNGHWMLIICLLKQYMKGCYWMITKCSLNAHLIRCRRNDVREIKYLYKGHSRRQTAATSNALGSLHRGCTRTPWRRRRALIPRPRAYLHSSLQGTRICPAR